jgi:hypothetical protein
MNWICEVCQKTFVIGQDRAWELDNRANPDNPYNPLSEIIHLCQDCHELGYILVRGAVRVWADSPASEKASGACLLVSGAQARCNPFHDMSTWPRSDGRAGLSRSIALSRWRSQR